MNQSLEKPNFFIYLAYLGLLLTALNTVYLVLPNDELKWYLMGFLVIGVMAGFLLSQRYYVIIGILQDLAGLVIFAWYGWRIFNDRLSFGTYLGEMLALMMVLRAFKLFRHHDFILPFIMSLTLMVFSAIPSFSADFVYSFLGYLIFLGLALFLGSIDEFARLPGLYRRRSAFEYTYDFLEEYRPVPLSRKTPVQLSRFLGPAISAGIPAVLLSFIISSGTYFTFEHTQSAGNELAILNAFGGNDYDDDFSRQTDLLTGMKMGGPAQHYVGFDSEFNIAQGRLVQNSTSNKVVMEVESNLPSYWRGKAFDYYTARGWKQSDDLKTAAWSLAPPVGQRRLYQGQIREAEVASVGIKPDPDLYKDQVRQTYYLLTDLPGIVFAAWQPIELSMPIPAVKIDETFTLVSPPASDSMVSGQRYEVVSKKHFAQADYLRGHDYDPQELRRNNPEFYKRYTQLPEKGTMKDRKEGFDFSRIRAKAYEVTAGKDSVYSKVEALEKWLEREYRTSLNPPAAIPQEKDAVEYFLFEWQPKRGHCEYFSSSLAVLCRSIGIPARVVTGYITGSYNLLKNRYIVQERHAHAWVEVYWPDIGWVEFDPTPRTFYQGIGERLSGGWLGFHNAIEELYVYNPRGYFRDKIIPTLKRAIIHVRYFIGQRQLDFYETISPILKWGERFPFQAWLLVGLGVSFLLFNYVLQYARDKNRARRFIIQRGLRTLRRVGKMLERRGVDPAWLSTETDYAIEAGKISQSWGNHVRTLVDIYLDARYSGKELGRAIIPTFNRACRNALTNPLIQ